jgi:hypothetical protein
VLLRLGARVETVPDGQLGGTAKALVSLVGELQGGQAPVYGELRLIVPSTATTPVTTAPGIAADE